MSSPSQARSLETAHPSCAATRAMHASLVLVWLGTALASALDFWGYGTTPGLDGEGTRLLAGSGIADARWQAALIWGGLLADLAVGLTLIFRPGRASYGAALILMASMTVVATVLQPALWLHPLGPLLKNLPIAAMLCFLLQAGRTTSASTRNL